MREGVKKSEPTMIKESAYKSDYPDWGPHNVYHEKNPVYPVY